MAHIDESLSFDHEENEIKDIIKLQALFRGALVRKWILETRQMYEAVVCELEPSQKMCVHWIRDKPCHPALKRKSSKRNKENYTSTVTNHNELSSNVLEKPGTGSSISRKDLYVEKTDKDDSEIISHRVMEREHQFVQKNSSTVETQTSFCETSRTENLGPTNSIDSEIVTLELDVEHSETITSTAATEKQNATPGDMNTLPFLPEMAEKERIPVMSAESHTLPHEDSTQGESFLNHTADIEHSLFRSMQNKTLNKSERQEEVTCTDIHLTSEKNAVFELEEPVKYTSHSPVAKGQGKLDENAEKMKSSFPGQSSEDLTSVTMATSVWDSFASSKDQINGYDNFSPKMKKASHDYPRDKDSLQELRKNIAMELLWVQQAINSRKNYLRLRSQMQT